MVKLLVLITVIAIVLAGYLLLPAGDNLSEIEPLNPEEFGLPSTAKEVVSKRTDKTATFSLGENKYAQVFIGGYTLETKPFED